MMAVASGKKPAKKTPPRTKAPADAIQAGVDHFKSWVRKPKPGKPKKK